MPNYKFNFLIIFHLKSALWVYGEYAKLRKKPESPLILDQNQHFLKSLFYTLDRFELSKKTSHATDPLLNRITIVTIYKNFFGNHDFFYKTSSSLW
jgi:hypothetical protein